MIYRGMCLLFAIAVLLLLTATASANAVIPGITGSTFKLATGAAYVETPDGDSVLVWGYRDVDEDTPVQYPGPTLIVKQGETVTVNLTNNLSVPVSMVFPGQGEVTASMASGTGNTGLLTLEANTGETVRYQFTATHPGTYMYHSGTRPELQIEMGLVGTLIVRPSRFDQNDPAKRTAYGHPDTAYDHEYLFLLSEMDEVIHDLVDVGSPESVDNTTAFPAFWFINGRTGLDTVSPPNVSRLPHQPYSTLVRTHPGEKVLLRFIGAGRDLHPFHPHGNHSTIIARDGRMVTSSLGDPAVGPDLATADFTYNILPGGTYDTIFHWTSNGLGWDIYGDPSDPEFAHDCYGAGPDNIDPATGEDCDDHGKPLPVVLPGLQNLTVGRFYSGSPFLGHFGNLSPGEGALNPNGGLVFLWHSHAKKELTNVDLFSGVMLTFAIIEPPGVPIP
jgi:FtsP/CotA-like multicopper oxidase with cupredoxin domain